MPRQLGKDPLCNHQAYSISSNKRRDAYLIFVILGAALIRGRRLIEGGAYFEI